MERLSIRSFAVSGDPRSERGATILRHLAAADLRPCDGVEQADVVLLLDEQSFIEGEVKSLSVPAINFHAAPLPGYRGNFATHWALYHDESLEVCAHLSTRDLDNGPILGRCTLPVRKGDELEDIDRRGFEVCGELAVQVIRDAMGQGIACSPQETWQGRTFRGPVPQDIIEECQRRLKAGEYSHYS